MVFEGLKTLEGYPDCKTLNQVACLMLKARKDTFFCSDTGVPFSAEHVLCMCLRKMTGLHEETLASRRTSTALSSSHK